MGPWASYDDQRVALERACARAGCRLASIAPRQTSVGTYAQARIIAPAPWSAAILLATIAEEDARTAGARDFALALRKRYPGDSDYIQAVFDLVRAVRFVREPGEVFASPSYTLTIGAGDCDDQARASYAILRAGGVPARIAFLHRGPTGDPSHAVTQAGSRGAWVWLETTVAGALLGESPIAAARRLGVVKARADLADCATAIDLASLAHLKVPMIGAIGAVPSYSAAEVSQFEQAQNTGDLSPGFFRSVADAAAVFRTLGAHVTGEDLLAVLNGESAIRAKAAGQNPDGSFDYGLNQLHTATTLKAVGFTGTPDQYVALTAEQQMPYVVKYFLKMVPASAWKRIAGARGLYAINGWPGVIARGVDTHDDYAILGVRGRPGYYPSFDTASVGINMPVQIDAWIARRQIQEGKRWIEARARYWIESGEPPARLSIFRTAVVLAGAAGIAWGAAHLTVKA